MAARTVGPRTANKSPSSVVVVMDAGGAELVIKDDDESTESSRIITPKPVISGPMKSLLDDEQSIGCTHTPTTASPSDASSALTRTPSSAVQLLCCGGKLESTISALLAKPIRLGAEDWQIWSYFGVLQGSTNDAQEEARKILKNRAFSIAERRRRMDSVRRDLSPFTLTPTRQRRSKIGKSFDLDEHRSRGSNPTRNQTNDRETKISSLVSMCGCNPSNTKDNSPAIIRSKMLDAVDEENCYDSDPEEFTRRQSQRNLLPVPPGNKENCNNLSNRNRVVSQYHHQGIDSEDFYTQQSVQEFINERFTLILHTKESNDKPSAPHAVKAWFERGQHLSCNGVIQPRFMWHSVDRNKRSKRRVTLPNVKKVSGFDLVDVARILEVDYVDRKLFPFAKTASCFLVKTLDAALLFEAKTKAERERLVRWLKVTVSRLASKLIVGDHTLFDEFFVVTGVPESGPGGAPTIL